MPMAMIKSHPEDKEGVALARGASKNCFSFNIYAMVESIDFKFDTQFGWPIGPIIKSYQ